MAKFEIRDITSIEGLRVITPTDGSASRDYLFDFDSPELAQLDLGVEFVERTVEELARGVIRGLHFQRRDAQGILVGVSSGRILDIAVDLRPESRSFGAAHSQELSAQSGAMLYIPPYFAHGFLTLEPHSEVVCNTTTLYDRESEAGIIWDDEILLIDWEFDRYEIDSKWLNISQRDRKLPSFRSYNPNSLWLNRPKKRR